MVPAIHNFWLGIMALAFAGAMATWLWLVLRADRHPHGYQHESSSMRREVLGGAFVAREGGRQVVPDRRAPPEAEAPEAEAPEAEPPEAESSDAEAPATPETVAKAPEQAEQAGQAIPGPRQSAEERQKHEATEATSEQH